MLRRLLAALLTALLLPGCATPPPALRLERPVVLLGEVHDNAEGHALRLRALDDLLARGARPALVMEQFDRGDQAAIDAVRQRQPAPSAAELIAAVLARRPAPAAASAPASGWDWRFYGPVIERALRWNLPVVAANVGRDEARQVMRDGLARHGFDAAVPEDLLAAQAAAIESGHCGRVGGALARNMALAQVARDQAMARAVEAHAARGVVLLAGNGHVQRDRGVPRWLAADALRQAESIGVLERGAETGRDDSGAFDRVVFTAAQVRPDPCRALR